MTSTRLGSLLVVLGAVVLALSAFADPLGLGSGDTAFGWKQAVGVVIGGLVVAAGAIILARGRRDGGGESPESTA